jgi:hypothetical protein
MIGNEVSTGSRSDRVHLDDDGNEVSTGSRSDGVHLDEFPKGQPGRYRSRYRPRLPNPWITT